MEGVQIDIGGIEAVEQHQAVCAGVNGSGGEGGDRRVVGGQLHRQRNLYGDLDGFDRGQVFHLDLGRGDGDIGGHGVQVQLQGVSTSADERLGIVLPGAGAGCVEAGDHRDGELVLGLLDQRDSRRQRRRFRSAGVLLEQGGQHHCRGTSGLQLLHGFEMAGHR